MSTYTFTQLATDVPSPRIDFMMRHAAEYDGVVSLDQDPFKLILRSWERKPQ
jgi:hypothetical protein